jgi:hypothetical protein
MRRPTPHRTGWRVKLAWIAALLLPGLVSRALLAAGADLGSHKVDIGRRYTLTISGNAYVKCNDSGCSGSRLYPVPIDDLELDVTLQFSPSDASGRVYRFDVRSGNHEFIPPLSGRLTLENPPRWTEQAKQAVRNEAGGRCDLSFEDIVPESFKPTPFENGHP